MMHVASNESDEWLSSSSGWLSSQPSSTGGWLSSSQLTQPSADSSEMPSCAHSQHDAEEADDWKVWMVDDDEQ
jgi:hypothetical protein